MPYKEQLKQEQQLLQSKFIFIDIKNTAELKDSI